MAAEPPIISAAATGVTASAEFGEGVREEGGERGALQEDGGGGGDGDGFEERRSVRGRRV